MPTQGYPKLLGLRKEKLRIIPPLISRRRLQVTTAVMQCGYRIIDDMLLGLRAYMAQRGYRHVSELVGLGVDGVADAAELERDTVICPKFRWERCVGCGRRVMPKHKL